MGMFESCTTPYNRCFTDHHTVRKELRALVKLVRKETWLKSDGREIKYCIDGKFIIHHMDLATLFTGVSCCQNMGMKPPSYVLTGMLREQKKFELTAIADDKLQPWPKEMVSMYYRYICYDNGVISKIYI